ncbi:MAG TPA: TrkH family potassium uptake protein [Firmicutes bacterium]|nr:TrkH family potassium uptake protein [Bacillota bacterium]
MRVFSRDLETIGFQTGRVLWGVAGLMAFPLLVAAVSGEWPVIPDFLIGMGVATLGGSALVVLCRGGRGRVTWAQGMLTVAVSWLVAMVVCAIPSWLSGHYGSFGDACFDVMSGFTTTGVVLIQDLDHVSDGLNTWRHLLSYLGGQGMVVLALTFLVRGLPGGYKLYVGEGKDERLLPSVAHTARAIWAISLIYLVVGTSVLAAAAMAAGMAPYRALLHGLWVFMAAWSTGGFAPHSQNILFYHSTAFEVASMVFFLIGSFNFGLHYAVWTGNRRELYRNLELQAFAGTATSLTLLIVAALSATRVYSSAGDLFRKAVYQLLSAHTTTGFMTVYPSQVAGQWGDLALLLLTLAMLLGGSASSTAGGFKGLRVGLAVKTVVQEVRRLLVPESALVVTRFHFFRDFTLEDRHVRSALLIMGLYSLTFAVAATATVAAGYPVGQSLFEAASVTGNVGLTAGVTSPSMPWALKALYVVVMWAGRLEFTAVLVLLGYVAYGRRTR